MVLISFAVTAQLICAFVFTCKKQVFSCMSDFPEDSHPEAVFTRHSRLAFTEITSYKADPSLKWLAITGLTPEVC